MISEFDPSHIRLLTQNNGRSKSENLTEVAKQFESLFVQMMLKNMRSASLGEGLLDNQQSEFYRELHDQHLARHLSQSGGLGIADLLVKQLSGRQISPRTPAAVTVSPPAPTITSPDATQVKAGGSDNFKDPQDFIEKLYPVARRAARQLGLEPKAILAQAALETGWGKYIPGDRKANSFNLFGIKADARWQGPVAGAPSFEVENGVSKVKYAEFRAYDSYHHSIMDYVRFLKGNPRYQQALGNTENPVSFFSALQQAGYASDPQYAHKVLKIMDGPTMEMSLSTLKDPSR